MNEDRPYSNLAFRGMALWLRVREITSDFRQRLVEAGLEEGQVVVDYGCGIGSYSIPAAQIVGDTGMVYAVDTHPLAIETVRRRARQKNLRNIKTIRSNLDTGLAEGSADLVLLYDVLHMVPDQPSLLQEIQRVLKPGGRLSILPDHMTGDELMSTVNGVNHFDLRTRHGKFYEFVRAQQGFDETQRWPRPSW
jgi:ubiquinone/menaquinone biosynthesis C-methylase UbiE